MDSKYMHRQTVDNEYTLKPINILILKDCKIYGEKWCKNNMTPKNCKKIIPLLNNMDIQYIGNLHEELPIVIVKIKLEHYLFEGCIRYSRNDIVAHDLLREITDIFETNIIRYYIIECYEKQIVELINNIYYYFTKILLRYKDTIT